ncbi:CobW family GTP-binding protein [Piscinibacter sakaiensis]|uniref:CobW family GTP-binding protein n=1 Tax=Piscinibacter sakaiensis TaxID=1547922 RepID=UPI003AABB1E2
MRTRDPVAGRLPVTLITGFLGSGKTTLLRELLRHPAMNRVAVVINEVGEIGIDNDLVTMVSENVSLLANGCLCCVVRTDLQETLRELFGQRRAGEIIDFDRVVIETTGLADPAPIVQTLASDTMLGAHYRLDGVVTLVDAVNGSGQLTSQPEAHKQVALADRLFITKTDLVDTAQLEALSTELRALNPRAAIDVLRDGRIDPAELTNLGLSSAKGGESTLRFLGELETGSAEADGGYLGQRLPARHDPRVQTMSLRFERPFSWETFSAALDMLINLRGPDLLRVKGIVNVDGAAVVVQGVQHVMHPPVTLDRWPSDDTDTRIVFITRGIAETAIRGLFDAVTAMRS